MPRNTSGRKMLFGVIGDPISHSISPAMHNLAIRRASLDAIYLPFHVKKEEIPAFIAAVKRWPCTGFNVTIPHKQTIMEFLDRITPDAREIGAVNTVFLKDGRLLGYNTDYKGYIRSLKEETKYNPHNRVVTLIGAGGGARAVVYGLIKSGVKRIFIFNKPIEMAEELVESCGRGMACHALTVMPWTKKNFTTSLEGSSILVNATPVGMKGTSFDDLPLDALPKDAIVSDLVYTPRETPLLKDAKRLGLKTHGGLGMLVNQGAESFKIWTGIEPDIAAMRTAAETMLLAFQK